MTTDTGPEPAPRLEQKARHARRAYVAGAAATGFFAVCCAGFLGVIGAAVGIGWLVALSASRTFALAIVPFLVISAGLTYYWWTQKVGCERQTRQHSETPSNTQR